MRYIVQPTADATRQQIGGKAAALASLQQADFPVPDWFALDARRVRRQPECRRP